MSEDYHKHRIQNDFIPVGEGQKLLAYEPKTWRKQIHFLFLFILKLCVCLITLVMSDSLPPHVL